VVVVVVEVVVVELIEVERGMKKKCSVRLGTISLSPQLPSSSRRSMTKLVIEHVPRERIVY
jgi:hypothetical protein